MQQQESNGNRGGAVETGEGAVTPGDDTARFEDLTVDDDLPIIDRVSRYCRSEIALQRLVHVKMLAECSELVGGGVTQDVLIPAVQPLVQDPESVIRQHLAAQLLPLCLVCMLKPNALALLKNADGSSNSSTSFKIADLLETPDLLLSLTTAVPSKKGKRPSTSKIIPARDFEHYYDKAGYHLVTKVVINDYLSTLSADPDLDVRRAAADSLSGLALHILPADIPTFCLPIPIKLAVQKGRNEPPAKPETKNETNNKKNKKSEAEQLAEELRITAANLLAEIGGAAAESPLLCHRSSWVGERVLPTVQQLCADPSFRVRRAAVQALPRILGACTVQDTAEHILPTFDALSHDDIYRVRKSTGECLVDMSRSLMIAAAQHEPSSAERATLQELRRSHLIPIADRLIQDAHKMVRQGMMQFLGPFMASFYPYQDSALTSLLPVCTESDGSNHLGIVAQFFPHATSMVSRLNSAQTAVSMAPTPVYSSLEEFLARPFTEIQRLRSALPLFLQAGKCSALSLAAVTKHRRLYPPSEADMEAIQDCLLDYFAALAIVSTGDENTDAEMRVYCAYSFPAVVLLLGPENWEGSLKSCFFTLINPNYGNEEEDDEDDNGNGDIKNNVNGDLEGGDDNKKNRNKPEPPLPVKRCLASSLHTIAHILGPEIACRDILPVVQSFFLQDSDDSVRLNVIRNFPLLLELLPPSSRRPPIELWSSIVRGEEFLGASIKRSATNPVVLNWRQRDYLARSMVDLFVLLDPVMIREHLWPILKRLLLDSVSIVREDAIWSIPMLFKSYGTENVQKWTDSREESRRFSTTACVEVIQWLNAYILKKNSSSTKGASRSNGNNSSNNKNISSSLTASSKGANFSERQLYCRICCATGLLVRLSEERGVLEDDDICTLPSSFASKQDPVSVLTVKFKSFVYKDKDDYNLGGSNSNVKNSTAAGAYKRLSSTERKHLKRLLLDELLPAALEMKEDRISNVRVTLMKVLQLMPNDIKQSQQVAPVLQSLTEEVETWESFEGESSVLSNPEQPPNPPNDHDPTTDVSRSTGPVDLDDISNSPQSSRDEDNHTDNDYPEDEKGDGGAEEGKNVEDEVLPPGWKTIVFEHGAIGLQLEPTVDDEACRVYGLLDAGPDNPGQARASGKIEMKDVIVKVNGHTVQSYDDTISILKLGGRRVITFRPGTPADDYDDGDDTQDEEDKTRREREKSEKKAKKAAKKAKKEGKRETKKDSKREKKKKDKRKKDH